MGILHSIHRFLSCKPEDEDDGRSERSIYPYLLRQRENQRNPYGDSSRSSGKLPKLTIFGSLIYNGVKGLLQKFLFVFSLRRLRKEADPILPITNPVSSSVSSEPLLVQTTLISSPTDDSSAAEHTHESAPTEFSLFTPDDQELGFDNIGALTCQTEQEEYYVTVSIPEIKRVSEETDSPDDDPFVEEIEEEVEIKSVVVVDGGRRIKHYSSRHRILLVGEGDFSFSACLALAFQSATNIIATSLDSRAFLQKNYANALSNIEELMSRKGKVMHGINATKIANHPMLGHLKYDRIIFNFPFAGFFKNLPRESQLRRHRRLVSLFLKNAREMIGENGEIHISHKTNEFHVEWKIEALASSHGLRLVEAVHFHHLDYPGYNTKCGFGGDNNFNCNPSKTYKFGLKKVCN